MYEMQLSGRTVLLRVDFNVPLDDNAKIVDTSRIDKSLPTIRYLLKQGAGVLLVSHLGRPTSSQDNHLSLKPVFEYLKQVIKQPVEWLPNWPRVPHQLSVGELGLAENIRFHPGETANDQVLAKSMARGIDAYVFDAFACAHRQHASTTGVLNVIDEVGIGSLVQKEVHQLDFLLSDQSKPLAVIVSGAKVKTKLPLLSQLLSKSSIAAVGGVLANTLLKHAGYEVGLSKVEPVEQSEVESVLQASHLLLPIDVVVKRQAHILTLNVKSVEPFDQILDLGPNSIDQIARYFSGVRSIFWNGPLGYFEQSPFDKGSINLAKRMVDSQTYTIIGGGDTMAAMAGLPNIHEDVFCSTGGGASLSYLTQSGSVVLDTIEAKKGELFV